MYAVLPDLRRVRVFQGFPRYEQREQRTYLRALGCAYESEKEEKEKKKTTVVCVNVRHDPRSFGPIKLAAPPLAI